MFKKSEIKPWLQEQWCIGKVTGEYLQRMEDVLDVYEQPYDEQYPVICYDEKPFEIISDIFEPLEMKQGVRKRYDYQYERQGVYNILCAYEPKTGKRIIEVTEHRTKKEFAEFIDKVIKSYPLAKKIKFVMDNLNTHNGGSFYEIFKGQEAFELCQKIEWHYTPVHASWLNMVEIEFSALARQCLKRRFNDIYILMKELNALIKERNDKEIKVNWQFYKKDARKSFNKYYVPDPDDYILLD